MLGILAAGCFAAAVAGADDPVPPRPAIPVPGSSPADVLTGAIRFVTVNPPGDEAPLASYFVELLRAAGIEAAVIDTPAGGSRVGRAAAWGRLPGNGDRPAIVLLSHLDTVPVVKAEWSTDPFAGRRVDGHVMGRGAVDSKGVAVVQLLAMMRLARQGVTLERDVIFLATPDEEAGGELGAGYIVRERADLLEGAGYLLTEGGEVLAKDELQRPIWNVGVTEKSPCWLRIVSRGRPGHSSVPPRDAAVPRLVAALARVQQIETPVRVVPPVAAMFAAMAPLAEDDDREGFLDLTGGLENDAAFRNRFLSDVQYAALVRNTLTTTVLQGSPGTNLVPTVASAHLDARLLPGESCGAFADQVRSVLADPGIGVEILLDFESGASTRDTALFRAIERVAAVEDPGALVVPRVNAGFTDAHFFRSHGLTAYGFVPRWHRAGEERGVHGPDERLAESNLERGIDTLIAILLELDRVEAGSPP